jgi:hypothetical protein
MALRRDLQDDAAAIGGVVFAMDETGLFAALAELDDAVVAQSQPLRHVRYGRLHAIWRSGDVEQKLVLLGMEAGVGGTLFAELEKLAQGVTKLS